MKSYHWNSFVPAQYGIDNIYVGTYPNMGWERFRNQKGFAFLQYRLKVDENHNGWDHYLAMFTSMAGVSWANAIVKENLLPGYYNFFYHFHFPHPRTLPGVSDEQDDIFVHNCYRASIFYGQDSFEEAGNGYNSWEKSSEEAWVNHANHTSPTEIPDSSEKPTYRRIDPAQETFKFGTGENFSSDLGAARQWITESAEADANVINDDSFMDIAVFRPTLVNGTDIGNSVPLWNSTADSYHGWQMFFTGIPLIDPWKFNGQDYETTP